MAARLERIDRIVTRLQRDVARMTLFTGTVLGPTRAVALLASGLRIYVDPRDRGCGINLLTEGKIEEDELAVLKRYLRPGATVLDVGANYGTYSISLAPYVRPGGRVIGFEPNPHICDLFRSSIYLNGLTGLVEARQLGAHDTNATLRFLIDETGPGGAHLISPDAAAPPGTTIIEVPVVRLDDHLSADFVADAIKIDVEGYEEQVLRGMRGLIERSPDPVILMELFYPFFADDGAFVRFVRFVNEDLGLTISRIAAGGAVIPVTIDALRGTTGSVLLSKGLPQPMPDLAITPDRLTLGAGAERVDAAVIWRSAESGQPDQVIAHGPYLYLPEGAYRLVIDAEFDGDFVVQLQENYGDLIARYPIPGGRGFEATVFVTLDAPMFEVLLLTTKDSEALRLRSAELWKVR